jgi:hypothetical protein
MNVVTQAINIIFDGPPGPEAGRFVEVETDDGKSIKIGEWEERSDGMWVLRIDVAEQKCRAEAKLRELVEAAEWRDECNALYSGMYQDWLCDDDEVSESQDWMESIFDISEAAETAYQAALNAAREG